MRFLLPLCLALSMVAHSAAADALTDVIERSEKSVVRIEVKSDGGDSLGSGFVIGPGLIATNVHVLAGAKSAKATFPDQKTYAIESTLHIDPSRDIAIAKLSGSGVEALPVLKFSSALPRKGETVVALGSPLGLSFTATQGVVSAIRPALELSKELGRKEIQGTWIQVDAALSPGNSGGPIINQAGEIVAMSTLASQGAQNLNFGISGSDIKTALASAYGAGPTSLASGVGKVKMGEEPHSGGEAPEPSDVPKSAIEAYVALGKSDFRSIKRDLTKEMERLRTDLKEMRAGQTTIPAELSKEGVKVVRVNSPLKRSGRTWFFRGELAKREAIDQVEERLRELAKIAQQSADPKDSEALLTLLWKYGPKIDTRANGTVGFLSDAIVLHAANDHYVLIAYDEAPYILYLESTAGLWPGGDVLPVPVYVSGTETIENDEGRTASLTVLKAVTYNELKEVVLDGSSQPAAAATAGSPSVAAAPTSDPLSASSGLRVWHDRSGKFSVQAVLLQSTETEVILRRVDGKTIRVPRASLSEADQRYLRN